MDMMLFSEETERKTDVILTFILVACSNRENGVLDVLVLIDLGLVQVLVKVWRVVILVRDSNPDEL